MNHYDIAIVGAGPGGCACALALHGHGIDKAMWSGLLAAKQAIQCFEAVDFSADFMAQYDREVYQKMGAELSRSFFIMRAVIRFPWLLNAVTWLGQHRKLTRWVALKLKI